MVTTCKKGTKWKAVPEEWDYFQSLKNWQIMVPFKDTLVQNLWLA